MNGDWTTTATRFIDTVDQTERFLTRELAITEQSQAFTMPLQPVPAVPHVDTFVARIGNFGRLYINPDEAYEQCREQASNMRRDPDIMDPLRQRQYAVCLLDWQIVPENSRNKEQKEACEHYTTVFKRIPYLRKMFLCLDEAAWFGKYGVNFQYKWDDNRPTLMTPRSWLPVHGDKIRFDWDTGQAGVMVSRIPEGMESRFGNESRVAMWTNEERAAVAIHKHEIEDGEFFEGRTAGSIHGIGLRTRVYWPWFIKQNLTKWLMEWAERAGVGFTIFYYELGNQQQKAEVERAAKNYRTQNFLIIPRSPDPASKQAAGVERIEVGSGGAQFFKDLLDTYYGDKIRRMIVGQTLTSKTGATGLGSNVAEQHRDTRDLIVMFDALNLGETITRELLWVMHKFSMPNATWKPTFEFVVEKQNPKELLEAADKFIALGGTLGEDQLREPLGFERPEPDDKILSGRQQQSSPFGMGGAGGFGGQIPNSMNGDGDTLMAGNGNGQIDKIRGM